MTSAPGRNAAGGLAVAEPGGYEREWGALVGAGTFNVALARQESRLPLPVEHLCLYRDCGKPVLECFPPAGSYHADVVWRRLRELMRIRRMRDPRTRWVDLGKGRVMRP